MSHIERAARIALFWHTWVPEFRKAMILEKAADGLSCSDGVVGAVLVGLEDIDPVKLRAELTTNKEKWCS